MGAKMLATFAPILFSFAMSPIDVCNQALSLIGDRKISRLDEEAQQYDPLARHCAEFYDLTRRTVLATHRWSFAKHAVTLVQRANPTTIGFQYAHVLPLDKLRVMSLHSGTIISPATTPTFTERKIDKFKIVGPDVWSNSEHVALSYIRDVEDPDAWTPHFTVAVSRLLARFIAGSIGADPRMVAEMLNVYERVDLPNAQYYDAVQDESGENARDNRDESPTLLARRRS